MRYGSASTTDLHQQLTDRGIGTLVLAGISTSGVVLSTLIDAAAMITGSTFCPAASWVFKVERCGGVRGLAGW
ncbi:cysteine hydrolase [Streptomyces sp. NBC_00057]